MVEQAKELAVILCFGITVYRKVKKLDEEMGATLFNADIIYRLFDAFTAYNEITEARRRVVAPQAIRPCRLRILGAFAKRDPIILAVDILDDTLRVGIPLCVIKKDAQTVIIHLSRQHQTQYVTNFTGTTGTSYNEPSYAYTCSLNPGRIVAVLCLRSPRATFLPRMGMGLTFDRGHGVPRALEVVLGEARGLQDRRVLDRLQDDVVVRPAYSTHQLCCLSLSLTIA